MPRMVDITANASFHRDWYFSEKAPNVASPRSNVFEVPSVMSFKRVRSERRENTPQPPPVMPLAQYSPGL